MTSIKLLLTIFQEQNYSIPTSGSSNIETIIDTEKEEEEPITRGVEFTSTIGNIYTMKNTNPHLDNLYGITNLISEVYMKGRYNSIITMSLYNDMETFDNINIACADDIFDQIDKFYVNQYPILFINIIPRQIHLHQGEMGDRLGEDACDVLKRYGFIDIGCRIHNIVIPKFVLIRANDVGSMGITENFKEFW